VLGVVGVDEPLERALPEQAVADDGGWHDADAEVLAEQMRRAHACADPARSPQRALCANRLADRLLFDVAAMHRDEKGGVRAPGHAAVDVSSGDASGRHRIRDVR
jgi:hypothetical protein